MRYMLFILKKICYFGRFLFILILFGQIKESYAFNWKFYVNRYPELKLNNSMSAFMHFLQSGFKDRRESGYKFENTNFDWEYYIQKNKIENIKTKNEAKNHYITYGRLQNLDYCQSFKICILLHLYNLELIDEFIEKINHFIRINNHNQFYIKINIPVDSNINKVTILNLEESEENILDEILNLTPHHKNLINKENSKKLYVILRKLRSRLHIPLSNLQVIFSENRGVDIGGFFLLMHQLIQQNLDIDYIVKLHTKTHKIWREILTSILNLRINKMFRLKEFIYTCGLDFNWNSCTKENFMNLMKLNKLFNVPKKNFSFCGGTMFIISKKFVDFFKKYNLINLFNELNKKYPIPGKEDVEHAYERFFCYLGEHLQLKTEIIGYITKDYMDPLFFRKL